MCDFPFRVIFNFQGCDSLLDSRSSTWCLGALAAEAGGRLALQILEDEAESVAEYSIRDSGNLAVLDSGGARENKIVYVRNIHTSFGE